MQSPNKSGLSFQRAKSFLYASWLLHVITLIEFLLCVFIIPQLSLTLDHASLSGFLIHAYILLFLLSLPVLSELDARSRYQNYKQIKDQMYLYGFNTKIIRPSLKSRCQRDAAYLAAKELGFGVQCRQFFRSNGYRWYHIFPDFVFQRPHFLLTRHFWITTFFTPTYNSRVDYSTLSFSINKSIVSCT
jgi:hypothetical protein